MAEFDDELLAGVGLDRRAFLKRLAIGSAFAVPAIASFDMASWSEASAAECGTSTRTLFFSNAVQPSPSVQGQLVTITAVLSCCSGSSNVHEGLVEFFDDGKSLGTAPADGSAQLTTSALALGTHTITATFLGSGDFCPSSSRSVTHEVTPAAYPLAVGAPELGEAVPPSSSERGGGVLSAVKAAAAVLPAAAIAAGVAAHRRAQAQASEPGNGPADGAPA